MKQLSVISIIVLVCGCTRIKSGPHTQAQIEEAEQVKRSRELDRKREQESELNYLNERYGAYANWIMKVIQDKSTAVQILGRPNTFGGTGESRNITIFSFSEWTYSGADLPTYDEKKPERIILGFNRKDELEKVGLGVKEVVKWCPIIWSLNGKE